MIYLIAGTTHTGKTLLAQKILTQKQIPYLSLDHLKMGLIRSGYTDLSVCDDEKLTEFLWPIVREMVKTAVENHQNLTVEGCYIPHNWAADFTPEYLEKIRAVWLVMTQEYIEKDFDQIRHYANAIERRLDDSDLSRESLIRDNQQNLEQCRKYGCDYILIDGKYNLKWP